MAILVQTTLSSTVTLRTEKSGHYDHYGEIGVYRDTCFFVGAEFLLLKMFILVYKYSYNDPISLIGQSAMIYFAGKLMEKSARYCASSELLYKNNRPQVPMV